jgi:glycosyltransferase involved in cell wall biosynthesis
MVIHFLVHDGVLEVGHTRAMMEVLRVLARKKEVKKIKIICLHASPPEILLPENPEKLEIKIIPGHFLKPFILKSLFFQLYTWWFKKELIQERDRETKQINPIITMGVCSFIGHLVNIQFYHQEWEKLYFQYNQGPWFKTIYKKLLLRYLSLCEDYYYKKDKLKFVFLSQFICDLMKERYQLSAAQYQVAYSSVNFAEYSPSTHFDQKEKDQILIDLKSKYPPLSKLNPAYPTLLFVGAYERKGLPLLIENLPENLNLIIIGKGEAHSSFALPAPEHKKFEQIISLSYSNEISKFYLISDAFIFPTYFEPFGLVVTEAAASGCQIFVTKDRVGASEILEGMPGISFISSNLKNQLQSIGHLSLAQRMEWARERENKLGHLTWNECAEKWWQLIRKI